MSNGINISLPKSEQDKFRAWVRKQTAETKVKCQGLIRKHTTDLHRRAQRSAQFVHTTVYDKKKKKYASASTYSQGALRGSIHMAFSGDMLGGIVTVGNIFKGITYAPYMEFGTGRFATMGILPGYEAYARQFKGRGIRQVNLRGRMYFYPHFERIKKVFIKDLNNIGFK